MFNFLSAVNKGKLSRVIKQHKKLLGTHRLNFWISIICIKRKAAFFTDPSHLCIPSFSYFHQVVGFRSPFARRKAYSNYFIPTAISILNRPNSFVRILCLGLSFLFRGCCVFFCIVYMWTFLPKKHLYHWLIDNNVFLILWILTHILNVSVKIV